MFEFSDDPLCEAAAGLPDAATLLPMIGEALLLGAAWDNVLNDSRWAQQPLYIVYVHDQLGTPDHVEGVCLAREEAETLAAAIDRRQRNSRPQHRHFYRCKLAEWRLGALAIREARDSFHREVIGYLIRDIKAALQEKKALPKGISKVMVGALDATDAVPAFIDLSGRRIVLWEDGCTLSSAEESIAFCTHARPPKCGLMNGHGEIVVPPAFQQVAPLRHGLAVAKRNGRFGYIDADGNVVAPFVYEDALDCCQDLLLVKSDGLWGALDRDGKPVIAIRYAALEHDSGNEALRATLDGQHGYLSLHGDLLVGFGAEPLYLAEQSFASDRAVFIARDPTNAARQVLVDALGQQIGSQAYAAIRYGFPDEGLLCAKMQDSASARYGYISLRGEAIIPFQFSDAGNFSEGLAAVALQEPPRQYGYIDRQGHWVIAAGFAAAGEFHQGLAVAVDASSAPARRWPWLVKRTRPTGGRYGYIDRHGEWAIAQRFLDAKPFSEGLAPVRLESGWAYIDISGNIGIPGPYHESGPFKQGVARVARRYGGPLRWGLIDIHGREIIPLRFDRLSYPKRGLITACDEFGLWGCVTLFGNIALPFVYRSARDLQAALLAHSGMPQ